MRILLSMMLVVKFITFTFVLFPSLFFFFSLKDSPVMWKNISKLERFSHVFYYTSLGENKKIHA